MHLELTKDQLGSLAKLVYLGNWLANSWRNEEIIEEYDEIESLVLGAAEKHGFSEYVETDEEEKAKVPSHELEEKMAETIDFYNDNTFWDHLIYRLADRDYLRKYGEEALSELDTEKGIEREKPLLEKYEKEFNEHGVERLEVRRDN
jgi:hypothetical protein